MNNFRSLLPVGAMIVYLFNCPNIVLGDVRKKGAKFFSNHPIDVKVGKKVTLPLRDKKYITCVSCHKDHEIMGTGQDIGNNKARTLRKDYRALCIECHADKNSVEDNHIDLNLALMAKKAKNVKVNSCSQCHSMHNAEHKLTSYPGTKLCVRCHQDKQLEMHKTGIVDIVAKTKRAKAVKLEGSKLGCVSCHDLHGGENKKAFINKKNKNTILSYCASCHGQYDTKKFFDSYHSINK